MFNNQSNPIMNKNVYQLLVECYDELSDIIVDLIEDYWDDPDTWDELAKCRYHLLKSRSIISKLSTKIVKS